MTQEEKILEHMLRNNGVQEWFYPPDFMKGGDLFVGYEASARLSEMAKAYPDMIESRRNGKYMERRIRYEGIAHWWSIVPEWIRSAMTRYRISPTASTQSNLF